VSPRVRLQVLAVVCLVVVLAAGVYLARAVMQSRDERATVSSKSRGVADAVPGPRLVFRTTNQGATNGLVSVLPLDRLSGHRATLGLDCDRVDANRTETVCLRTRRGVVTTFEARMYDAKGHETAHWPLPGIPSRTRLSPSGRLVADTTFVTGHSYMQVGFSTATEIRRVGGASYGNLEKFALMVDGRRITASDRNIWGVTFAKDDNTFYATAAFGGKTWLVRGDLAKRTLTSVRENAECPSLSPDEQRVAYKKKVPADSKHWSLAVLDLASGQETVLGEKRSVDDQAEWLDDHTLLYGLPRAGDTGVTDVWRIGTEAGARPQRVVEEAWSPSVVR
jgi:hypothetical protein